MSVPIPPATVSTPPDTLPDLPPSSRSSYTGGAFWHAPMYHAKPLNIGVGIVVLMLIAFALASWRKPK